MSIGSRRDLDGLRAAGRVVAFALAEMRRRVARGVTTGELDDAAAAVFARHGARSAPQLAYRFPGVTCISVNDEAVHGVPGDRRLEDGDLVKLDVTAELNGYMADAAVTVGVGAVAERDRLLIATTRRALAAGILAARAGAPVAAIGAEVEQQVQAGGFRVLRALTGHGIGREIHEAPTVPNFPHPLAAAPLTEGLVITVEPIVAVADRDVHTLADGWTTVTAGGSRVAHFEHTIAVTGGRPILLTAA